MRQYTQHSATSTHGQAPGQKAMKDPSERPKRKSLSGWVMTVKQRLQATAAHKAGVQLRLLPRRLLRSSPEGHLKALDPQK